MPAKRAKETLLQVKERTAREIRNRTEARVRALLSKDPESEDSSSDEEDLIFIGPPSSTVAKKSSSVVALLASIIVILLLVILLLIQHIYLTRRN
jgi:hypothetical protein